MGKGESITSDHDPNTDSTRLTSFTHSVKVGLVLDLSVSSTLLISRRTPFSSQWNRCSTAKRLTETGEENIERGCMAERN